MLCAVACIKFLNIPYEEQVATIELPSGDRIIIKYYWDDFLSAYFKVTGGLKYEIHSNGSKSSGQLTGSKDYDGIGDAMLTHEIQGERRVKIEDGRSLRRSWIFVGDSSGQYKVTELPRQKEN
jgi:hypothetical protein